MKTIHKHSLFALTTIALVLCQLAMPVTAFADDDPPPAPTEPTVVTPTPDPTETTPPESDPSTPDASASPTLAPIETGTPAPNDSDLLTDAPSNPTITEPPADGTNESQVPLLETVQTVSDTTNVVVLDENGNPVPLVSQEAAEIVATGDPIWCPAGFKPGDIQCSDSYPSLSALIADSSNIITGDGIIWIQSGTQNGDPVNIDGCASYDTNENCVIYSAQSNFSLTLQGGWNGNLDSNGVLTTDADGSIVNSNFSVPITISNWNGDVVINNIAVTNPTPGGYGIMVTSTGDLTLENVTLNMNGGKGGRGAELRVTGDLNLKNVEFSNNFIGLLTYDSSNVFMSNVTANDNTKYGVYLQTVGNVIITGNNEFTRNGTIGLVINTPGTTNNGDIDLNNITATENGTGVVIHNSGTGDVTIRNSTFNNNSDGLSVYSNGNISLLSITAKNNDWGGVYLFTAHDAAIYATEILNNPFSAVDASAVCGTFSITGSYDIVNLPVNGWHTYTYRDLEGNIQYVSIYCRPKVYVNGVLVYGAELSNQYEFDLTCDTVPDYPRTLPNGDKVTIFCPVSGKARLSRLDNTSLPKDLPEGFTYASAFDLKILQGIKNDTPISVINEGGSIKASFDASHLQPGSEYSILYFDEATSTWIPLKDFMLDEHGNTLSFNLIPNDPADTPREIISGVNLVTKDGIPRVEVSTNFPGTFVLVQR